MDERELKRQKRQERLNKRMKLSVTYMLMMLCVVLVISLLAGNVSTKEKNKKPKGKDAVAKEKVVEKKPVEVSISMVGDILMHSRVIKSGLQADGSYNYDHLFSNMKETFSSKDISIVNQEVILGGTEIGISTYPCFNAPQEVGDAYVNAGINTVLHASNHTLDKGKKGVDSCMNFWKTKHPDVAVLGINESQEQQDNNIYVYEKDGFKIAILNYTYGTNGIPIPSDSPYIVNLLDEEKIDADLKKANELADFVIVCPHWGEEYQFKANEEQKKWADFFVKRGVDLVIGTHSHVIQPVEWVEDAETGNKMLVYYSLGNFVSTQEKAYSMVGGLADVTVVKDGKGNVSIKEYGVEPLVTHIGTKKDFTTYFLKNYTPELAAQNKVRSTDSKFSVDYCKNLSREVFGDLYKE